MKIHGKDRLVQVSFLDLQITDCWISRKHSYRVAAYQNSCMFRSNIFKMRKVLELPVSFFDFLVIQAAKTIKAERLNVQ